jgi:uncharacterized OsmC-like protein
MKISLISDDAIRLELVPGPLVVEAESEEQQYSPFHMLASALATCTMSVLYSWATHAEIPVDGLTIDVSWTFAENPHRVGGMALRFVWPGLPANRAEAAKRAAKLCAIHATLEHPPAIEIDGAASAAPATAHEHVHTHAHSS